MMKLEQTEQNVYEQFEERFGDYVFYQNERQQVLEEFRSAYLAEDSLEKLLMVENPDRIEEDVFQYFVESRNPDGVLSGVRSLLGRSGEEEYSEFMQDFELEAAEENMLYWCRYDPS